MREHYLWKEIQRNKELRKLEQEGFERGEKRGKKLTVHMHEVWKSFQKQYIDLENAYQQIVNKQTYPYDSFSKLEQADVDYFKKCIADLRNVAGCLFLKMRDLKAIQELAEII